MLHNEHMKFVLHWLTDALPLHHGADCNQTSGVVEQVMCNEWGLEKFKKWHLFFLKRGWRHLCSLLD